MSVLTIRSCSSWRYRARAAAYQPEPPSTHLRSSHSRGWSNCKESSSWLVAKQALQMRTTQQWPRADMCQQTHKSEERLSPEHVSNSCVRMAAALLPPPAPPIMRPVAHACRDKEFLGPAAAAAAICRSTAGVQKTVILTLGTTAAPAVPAPCPCGLRAAGALLTGRSSCCMSRVPSCGRCHSLQAASTVASDKIVDMNGSDA